MYMSKQEWCFLITGYTLKELTQTSLCRHTLTAMTALKPHGVPNNSNSTVCSTPCAVLRQIKNQCHCFEICVNIKAPHRRRNHLHRLYHSIVPWKHQWRFKKSSFSYIFMNSITNISAGNVTKAITHDLNPCWPIAAMPKFVTRAEAVNKKN